MKNDGDRPFSIASHVTIYIHEKQIKINLDALTKYQKLIIDSKIVKTCFIR